MIYISYDTECTGKNKNYQNLNIPCSVTEQGSEVIQIGGLVLNEAMEPMRAFCHYCDCIAAESDAEALAVHGIPLEEIRKRIPNVFLEDVLWELVPEFFAEDVTFIGYNLDFDNRMVSQSLRNFCVPFVQPSKVTTSIPKTGRHAIDVMSFMPKRQKLVSYKSLLDAARSEFYVRYAGVLTVETNVPDLLNASWQHAHNALFDAIETTLLFKETIWQKKLIGGGNFGRGKRS